MKDVTSEYNNEFQDMLGDISKSFNANNDSVAIGSLLYSIAQERKNTNLVVREINAKFDQILQKINHLEVELDKSKINSRELLSDRDQEILEFVLTNKEVCAETLQKEFNYKGTNAASSRLNSLFKKGLLAKKYQGRKVIYTPQT